MMKVKKMIELLKKENKNAEIFAYLGATDGYSIVDIGINDAIIGKGKSKKKEFVLIPIQIPEELTAWRNEDE